MKQSTSKAALASTAFVSGNTGTYIVMSYKTWGHNEVLASCTGIKARYERMISTAMLRELIQQMSRNAVHADKCMYNACGIEEEPHNPYMAIIHEIVDSWIENQFLVTRKDWDGDFIYTFAGGTTIQSSLPLNLEEFAKEINGEDEDLCAWENMISDAIYITLNRLGVNSKEFKDVDLGGAWFYGIALDEEDVYVKLFDDGEDKLIPVYELCLDREKFETIMNAILVL